ncbi:MAG: Transporter substrate-binding protein [Acidobacteriota bacterium]|nr:Transporter substrate-binding protein [Acidobacteriota bacterium]
MTKYARPLLSFTGAFSLLFCSFTSPAIAADDDSLQKVVDAGVLRVAAEPGTPPMLFKEGNRYDGFDYAIAKAVAKRIGVDDVIIVAGKYSELPARLIAGKADVIISGYTADDSITGIDWSEAYLDYGLCLVVKKGRAIRSTDDLRGKVIGIFNDPAAEDEVKSMNLGQARIEKYEDGYFDLLDQGKIDGFIYDFPYAQEEIKEFGGRLEIVEFNLSKSTYNVGVRRDAATLLKMVNAAVRGLKASDEYRQIVRKYLGGTGPAPVAKVAAGQSVYKVRPGDTLSGIARDQMGNMRRWTEIWEANRNRIADPNLIDIGWELVLPAR